MHRAELATVYGVPETLLTDGLLARLPDNKADAPWECRCSAILWLGRGGATAQRALAPAIATGHRALVVVGGMIRYTDTPVGAYDEVFGAIGFREGLGLRGHVAFMAVDSEVSLVGGRTNWAMPKTLASFSGDIGSGASMSATSSDAVRGWSVRATPRPFGLTVPARAATRVVQQFAGGRLGSALLSTSFAARPGIVDVAVEGAGDLPAWLRPGRHLGVVLPQMTFTLGTVAP